MNIQILWYINLLYPNKQEVYNAIHLFTEDSL
jgi:hypothetical protein